MLSGTGLKIMLSFLPFKIKEANMGLLRVGTGEQVPEAFNVIIEIPMHSGHVKYEIDKDTGALKVDRLMSTAMFYPANYGYIPQTLSLDGDPVDVLVITPTPLLAGSVILARPIALLRMTDESGVDAKILAVPVSKLTKIYDNVHGHDDLPSTLISSIQHFFTHYKDLESGKWVKIDGWDDFNVAKQEVLDSRDRFAAEH